MVLVFGSRLETGNPPRSTIAVEARCLYVPEEQMGSSVLEYARYVLTGAVAESTDTSNVQVEFVTEMMYGPIIARVERNRRISNLFSTLASPDCRGRPHASTRGGVQVSVAAYERCTSVWIRSQYLENLRSETRPRNGCFSATEQLFSSGE